MIKKILLFSDSHGDRTSVNKVMERIDQFDKIVFAGDGAEDTEDYVYVYPEKFIGVKGNCDNSNCMLPEQAIINIGGAKILVVHGNRLNVKYGLDSLLTEAISNDVNAVFYGHTHRAKIEDRYGITFVNGGALSTRHGNIPSYAEIEINAGNIFAKIMKMT